MFGVDRFDPGRQPSGRTPAPGRLGLDQAFANSFWDLDDIRPIFESYVDELEAGLAARGFGGGAPVTEADRTRAIELREALRRLALGHHDGVAPTASDMVVLNAAARRAPLHVRFDGDGTAVHEPASEGPDVVIALVLGVVAEATADGRWSRVKACPGPHCGWVFYDASRNRSRQWCSMQLCGNRVKGREFRARRRGEGAAAA